MIQLTGYQIGENIYKSHNTLVYRGLRLQDKKPVIFKLLMIFPPLKKSHISDGNTKHCNF